VSLLCTHTHPGDAPRCPEQRFTCHYGRNHHPRHGWIGINKAIAVFIPGCDENHAGAKFRNLGNSGKSPEFSILKEFIQKKSFGHKKTRACRFSVLLRILAMLPGTQSNALRAIMVIQKIPLDCVVVRLSSTCWWLQFHFIFLDLLLILLAKLSHFTGDVLGLMNENIFRFS